MNSSTMYRCGMTAMLALAHAATAASVSSTFDVNAEGWTANAPTLTYQPAGGNPGGYLRFVDNNSLATQLVAPAAFLGDLSAFNNTGAVWYDMSVFASGVHSTTGTVDILLSGPGGEARWIGPDPEELVGSGWHRFRAPLQESAWEVTSGTWNALLGDVALLRIVADPFLTTGPPPETMGYDNIRLTNCPGDTNGDGVVNFTDLNEVLSAFGQTGESGFSLADLNGDGVVNFSDLNAVLSAFGTGCQ